MNKSKNTYLLFLFLLAFGLFNFPIIDIFNIPKTIFSIPILYVYLFVVWSLLILAIALLKK